MFLAIVFVGLGSSWVTGKDKQEAAKAAFAKVRRDWKDFRLPKSLVCNVYDLNNVPDQRWHADDTGVYGTTTGKRLPFVEAIQEQGEAPSGSQNNRRADIALTTKDGLTVYDLDPQASELWAVAGPAGFSKGDIDPDNLPEGFRWVTAEEWEGLVFADLV